METLHIELPVELKAFVDEQAAAGGHDAGTYVRQLIQADQRRQARERIEALLLEGIHSGEASEMTAADWAELHRRVWERNARQQQNGAAS